MLMSWCAPPEVPTEQWEVVPFTDHRGKTRYELHKGWTVRVWDDSHARIRYRSLKRATRVRDRLRNRDARMRRPARA